MANIPLALQGKPLTFIYMVNLLFCREINQQIIVQPSKARVLQTGWGPLVSGVPQGGAPAASQAGFSLVPFFWTMYLIRYQYNVPICTYFVPILGGIS